MACGIANPEAVIGRHVDDRVATGQPARSDSGSARSPTNVSPRIPSRLARLLVLRTSRRSSAPCARKRERHVVADKAGRACDENFHGKDSDQSTAISRSAATHACFRLGAGLRLERDKYKMSFERKFHAVCRTWIQARLLLQIFRQGDAPAILYTAGGHVATPGHPAPAQCSFRPPPCARCTP